jgi:hypothetical protein
MRVTERDQTNEELAAQAFEETVGWKPVRFPPLCPIDWYAESASRLRAVMEVKSRSHAAGQYPTIFLSLRKYIALTHASLAFGCEAFFIVRFRGGEVRDVNVWDVDAKRMIMGGVGGTQPGDCGREPLIEVPVDQMVPL